MSTVLTILTSAITALTAYAIPKAWEATGTRRRDKIERHTRLVLAEEHLAELPRYQGLRARDGWEFECESDGTASYRLRVDHSGTLLIVTQFEKLSEAIDFLLAKGIAEITTQLPATPLGIAEAVSVIRQLLARPMTMSEFRRMTADGDEHSRQELMDTMAVTLEGLGLRLRITAGKLLLQAR